MIDKSPIKPGEMGIIIASRRADLKFIIGLVVECIRYTHENEIIEIQHPALMGESKSRFMFCGGEVGALIEHPVYGRWIHGLSRIMPIRPDSEDEETQTEKELESIE